MPNGKVYDPLVGQWMTPTWEGLLSRVYEPKQLHLYRFNGNDPVNVNEGDFFLKGTYFLKCTVHLSDVIRINLNIVC